MKRLLIALLLVMPVSLCAQDFLQAKADYRKQIRRKVGIDTLSTGWATDANLDALIEEGVAVVLPLMRAYKGIDSFVTTYRQNTYTFDSKIVGVSDVFWQKNDSTKVLKYLPIGQWGDQSHQTTYGQASSELRRPSYYDYVDDKIFLFPTPYSKYGDTIKIIGWFELNTIVASDSLKEVPQVFRPAILAYAAWGAAFARNDPRAKTLFDLFMWSVSSLGESINSRGRPVAEKAE